MKAMKLIIATRGSTLALEQTKTACLYIQKQMPEVECSLSIIHTKGDKDRITPLHKMSSNGVFIKEVEEALLSHKADIAIHSAKDLPSILADGLTLLSSTIHEDARDVLLTKDHCSLNELRQNAIIATSSIRRMACIHNQRPDIRFVNIRGNIDTRLKTFAESNYDGMVLAAAGLKRLGKTEVIDEYLSPSICIPACGQGSIAIEVRMEDREKFAPLFTMQETFEDKRLRLARKFLVLCKADCHSPVGFYLEKEEKHIHVHAMHGQDAEHCAFVHFTIDGKELEKAPQMAWDRLRGMQ